MATLLNVSADVTPVEFFEKLLPLEHKRISEKHPPQSSEPLRMRVALTGGEGEGGGIWMIEIAGASIQVARVDRSPAGAGADPGLLWMTQPVEDWRALMRDAATGGALMPKKAGPAAILVTDEATRRRLKPLSGATRFELTEFEGRTWWMMLGVGERDPFDDPDATISMRADDYRALSGGKIDPMTCYMQGKVRISGDTNLAMQYGLAMLPLFQ